MVVKITRRVKPRARKAKPAKRRSTKVITAIAGAPIVAPGSPKRFRLRVRMYRHGLGDCFLLTFPREGQDPFHILIDFGALARDAASMTRVAEHIRDTVRNGKPNGKARLDVVVGTHEHKDHLSGFNQARATFNQDFDFGSVWLAWTENLTDPEIRKIKETRRKAISGLRAALASPLGAAAPLAGVAELFSFSEDDDTTGTGRIAEAVEYLKLRGKDAGDLRYLEPGTEPIALDGVANVRVYVLGPPRDPLMLKTSAVTEAMKKSGVIYHLTRTGEAGMDALRAAVGSISGAESDQYHPFAEEHRIAEFVADPLQPNTRKPNPYYASIRHFLAETYDNPAHDWRRIDHDWMSAFGQLALDLDNDTNNTSLVLAFEFVKTGEVLLFPADAQVGNWQSWAKLQFTPAQLPPIAAHDLLKRTAFYKVGHHCSHNATLKTGGLELMNRDDLVAFIPLDIETAKKQGTKGWQMPAPALFTALNEKAKQRVVISDVNQQLSAAAKAAGVFATETYIDYFVQ